MGTVLVLARETPYPPNAGDRVVTHGFVRGLAERGHEVHVLAYGDESDCERAEELTEYAKSVHLVRRASSDLPARLRKLRNYATGRSDVMAMFGSPSLVTATRERLRHLEPDVLLAEHPYIGQVFRDSAVQEAATRTDATLVTNAHVVEFAVHRRYRRLAPGLETRAELALETPRLRREELAVYQASDRVVVLGSEDREELVEAGVETPILTQHVGLDPDEYDVGPDPVEFDVGSDPDEFDVGHSVTSPANKSESGRRPVATVADGGDGSDDGHAGTGGDDSGGGDDGRGDDGGGGDDGTGDDGGNDGHVGTGGDDSGGADGNDSDAKRSATTDLLFFGSYGWFPNEDAITTFADAAWPRIRDDRPDARLLVAGRNAPESVRLLGDRPGIEFVGEIPDLGSAVRDAAAVVAPLRIGGGTRLKVLESMAWGAPVVTTAAGFEGVDARPGAEVAVADDWRTFAEKVAMVLDSPERRARLAWNARRRIEQVYALDGAAAELEANLGLSVEE